jgi:hypothetical protein
MGLSISAAPQFRGNGVRAARIAHRHRFGSGIDLGRIGEDSGLQFLIDDGGKLLIEVGESPDAQNGE